jgi:hypothetical protein
MRAKRGGNYYSLNTEIWLSDFFWPFFANYSCEDIMNAVLDALMEEGQRVESATIGVAVPKELIESFGVRCRETGLVDEKGYFTDCSKLAFFLGGIELSE